MRLELQLQLQLQLGCTVTLLENLGLAKGVRVKYTHKDQEHHITASLVIAADGASSRKRLEFRPDVQRTYAGHIALRGTAAESGISAATAAVFVERFAFFHGPGVQALGYTIPGPGGGSLTPGFRLVNWVWYRNYPADSPQLSGILTDT